MTQVDLTTQLARLHQLNIDLQQIVPDVAISVGEYAKIETYTLQFPANTLKSAEDAAKARLAEFDPVAPTRGDISMEKMRRTNLPIIVTINGTTFPVDMDNGGRQNVSDLGSNSASVIQRDPAAAGQMLQFTDANDVDQTLTLQQTVLMGNLCASRITAIHEASRVLKHSKPIPTDFAADRHWPDPAAPVTPG